MFYIQSIIDCNWFEQNQETDNDMALYLNMQHEDGDTAQTCQIFFCDGAALGLNDDASRNVK